MKLIAFLFAALFAVSSATPFMATNRALAVRGGQALGPLDGDMAMKLSKTVATAYVAGAASKYIASNTGGSSTQVCIFNTIEWTSFVL